MLRFRPIIFTATSRAARRAASLAASLAALFVASLAAASAPERTLLAQPPRPIADFKLTSHTGQPMRLSELRGAPALVFFGFTRCPTVCPTALLQLQQLERQHKTDLGKTRIIVISVDGERDSPKALADWLRPISPGFLGLTGAPDDVRKLASQFSAAFYKTPGTKPGDYLVEHNAQIFLLDADGRLHATFFNAPVATMAQVTRAVREARNSAALR